jgi:sec-independent protein translocase protein TatA
MGCALLATEGWCKRKLREVHVLGLSIWKLAIIGGIIVLLFGKGKISGMMGDLAQGIKSFKRGMSEDESGAKALDEAAQTVGAPIKEKVSG